MNSGVDAGIAGSRVLASCTARDEPLQKDSKHWEGIADSVSQEITPIKNVNPTSLCTKSEANITTS